MFKQKAKKLKKYQKPKIKAQRLLSKLYYNFGQYDIDPKSQGFIDQFLLAAAHFLDSY